MIVIVSIADMKLTYNNPIHILFVATKNEAFKKNDSMKVCQTHLQNVQMNLPIFSYLEHWGGNASEEQISIN